MDKEKGEEDEMRDEMARWRGDSVKEKRARGKVMVVEVGRVGVGRTEGQVTCSSVHTDETHLGRERGRQLRKMAALSAVARFRA